MEPVLLAALIIVGGLIALLLVTLPVLIIVGGVYLITQVKQDSLNMREQIRSERAIAKMNFEGGAYGADDDGGLDLGGMLDIFQQLTNRPTGPQPQTTGVTENGTQTENQL